MPRAEEVLVWAGIALLPGQRLPTDRYIRTSCPTCGAEQALSEGRFSENDETVYTCKNGCQPILIIGAPGNRPWTGRGYRMGNFVVRNPSDLDVPVLGHDGNPLEVAVRLPASPAALAPADKAP